MATQRANELIRDKILQGMDYKKMNETYPSRPMVSASVVFSHIEDLNNKLHNIRQDMIQIRKRLTGIVVEITELNECDAKEPRFVGIFETMEEQLLALKRIADETLVSVSIYL